MLNKLFASRARVEVLKLFLFNSEESFYQSQISSLTHQPIRGVQREMDKFEKVGLIEKSVQGNRVYYRMNKRHPIFEDLKSIFVKSVGIATVLKENLKKANNIKLAFVYGSYANGEEELSSDIDLLVIGSISSRQLSTLLSKAKRELSRGINYALFPPEEVRKRVRRKDNFLKTVLMGRKIYLIGSEDELEVMVPEKLYKDKVKVVKPTGLCGIWQDERNAEEIIDEIRGARSGFRNRAGL